MPRRAILSANDQASLLALPDDQDDLICHYTFKEQDLSLIKQRRGDANRLGFAIQLCLLRYPGYALTGDVAVTEAVITWVANQIKINPAAWDSYGKRDETRREHWLSYYGIRFTLNGQYKHCAILGNPLTRLCFNICHRWVGNISI